MRTQAGTSSRPYCCRCATSTAVSPCAPAAEWPLARTQWTKFHLDIVGGHLAPQPDSEQRTVSFDALGEGLEFWTLPLEQDVEITGPAPARLSVASSSTDADLFLTLRVADPSGRDVAFVSGQDPKGCVGFGWLRASHRKTKCRAEFALPAVAHPR